MPEIEFIYAVQGIKTQIQTASHILRLITICPFNDFNSLIYIRTFTFLLNTQPLDPLLTFYPKRSRTLKPEVKRWGKKVLQMEAPKVLVFCCFLNR